MRFDCVNINSSPSSTAKQQHSNNRGLLASNTTDRRMTLSALFKSIGYIESSCSTFDTSGVRIDDYSKQCGSLFNHSHLRRYRDMSNIKNKLKIDAKMFSFEVKEMESSKSGYFYFDSLELTVQVGYKADEHGNVEALKVIEALDNDNNNIDYCISADEYDGIANQIEPYLWDYDEYTRTDHGMTNADFLYGFKA